MSNSTVVPANSQPVFNFGEKQVRIILRDGEPWFVASDVAEALGYRNAPDAARSLSEHQKASTHIVRSTSGGNPNVTIINESGLYRLVLRSRKPEAEKFSDWVTGEVLPSIRKTGQYQQPVAQADPAIDYTRISPAQAQDLREIVQAIVEAKIQGHGETWARFQRKFKVNSYLQLPYNRYEEARQYLIAKLPNGYDGTVVDEPLAPKSSLDDAVRMDWAFTLAAQAAAKVQRAVFNCVMNGGEDWKRGRYLLSFDRDRTDDELMPKARQIESNVNIVPIDRFYAVIEDSICVDAQTLSQLATTCMTRLSRMAQNGTRALAN